MSKRTSICFCQSHHPPMPCYLKDLFFNLDNLTSTHLWAIYLPLWFCLLRGFCTPIMFPLFNCVCAHRYFNAHFWVLGRGYLHKPDWKVSFQSRVFWIEHCVFAYEALFTFLFALNEYIRFFHVETKWDIPVNVLGMPNCHAFTMLLLRVWRMENKTGTFA